MLGGSEVSFRDALRSGYSTEYRETHSLTFALGGHGSALGKAKANDNRLMILIGG